MSEPPAPAASPPRNGGAADAPDKPPAEIIQQQLEAQLVGVLDDPRLRRKVVERTAIVVTELAYSGPLPPPAHLAGYEAILPGSADRMLNMAEQEQQYRHRQFESGLASDDRYRTWGLCLGAAVSALLIGVGAVVTIYGYPWVGTVCFGGVLLGMANAFIQGQKRARSEPKKPAAPTPRDASRKGR